MKLKQMIKRRAITTALVALVAYGGLELYQRRQRHETTITAPVLKETEKSKTIVDTSRREVTTVTRKGGQQVVKVKEGVRKIVVTETNNGTIQVEAINKGFCLEPGVALYFSDSPRLGLDAQLAYYKRWGVLAGVGVNLGDEPRTVRAHIAVSYALPLNLFSNTSAFVGVDHKGDVAAGLRLRF